ncbi:efflux RND transporter permease subunit [Brevibacillus humidisoli]|uniref:efflux RND transporter permease subunit n=1 Tax=Brevibacillus humidisoli TaxID=2895522 RepID=UPI001E4E9A98|nr:efflux RND transporter permease subunit [Brevibacillus humidisoli]UFJ39340.1 efflux RND transporter permease subunit [Brevibacillus humidisoli]
MNLSGFSIKRPVTILMVCVALILFGFVSLPRLAVELYPELNLPVAVVVTSVDGAAPAEVENLVTKPIEEAVGTTANVSKLMSNSAEGASQVIIQFDWGTDMDQALLDVRDKVDLVKGALPDSANAPRILKLDPNSMPIFTLALSGEEDIVKLKSVADDVIKPRLERVEGVASVGVSGGRDRVIEIVLDPNKTAAYGITIDQVQQALSSTNVSGTAGSVRKGDGKLNIRVEGEYGTVQAIGNTPIRVASGSIPLKNIAEINDTYKEVTQKATLDGQPSVGLNITKASGGNTVEVADEVNKALQELKAELPENMKLTTIMDASVFIKDSIYTVAEHALVGGLFSIVILLLFLNSFRSMLIVAIVIPISVITTFCLMYFTGQTINMISLGGLTLGLGSLVDFAVVILENVYRLRQEGKSMLEAAKLGSQEVGTAVMASALAQISVFLPIVFVEGLASELFGPMALAVVYSHVAALFVSLALVPMLSSRWLKRVPDESIYEAGYRGLNPIIWFNVWFSKVSRLYGRMLRWSLSHRKTVIGGTIVLFIGAIALTPMVGAEFIPGMDQGKISVSIKTPNGTVLSETEKVVQQAEAIVKEVPELEQLYISMGSSGGPAIVANAMSNQAQLELTLVDKEARTRETVDVVEDLRQQLSNIAGAEITVSEVDQSGTSSGSPVSISLRGDDLDVLKDISSVVMEEIKSVPGMRNVSSSLEETQVEYQVEIDADQASHYGLSTSQILSNVRTVFQGQTVTRYRTGEDEIDVVVKMPETFQEDISFLNQLRITTASGAQVPLSSVATITEEAVPQMISRTDQAREVSITGDTVGRDLNSITMEIRAKLDQLSLPDGYIVEMGGDAQEMAESFSSLGLAIILSIALVYMVMASQFESLFSPFIIMFSIPPTLIGVVVGLLLTGNPLSVPALIGYILLIGIVVNNAIVLIDYVNTLRKRGEERNEAILQAGPLRLRPILMTTLTTVLAIMPLAFGGGSGNESMAPMAIVVIFGLSFSTLITLFLIPVVYTLFDDWGRKIRGFRFRKRRGLKTAAEEAGPSLEGGNI